MTRGEYETGGDAGELRDFESLAADLEAENPQLAEQRILREEAEAFQRRLRERLRAARRNISQGDVAQRMGINAQSRVSRLEMGYADLSIEALYRYARAVGYVPVISLVPAAGFGAGEASDQPGEAAGEVQAAQPGEAAGEAQAVRDVGAPSARSARQMAARDVRPSPSSPKFSGKRIGQRGLKAASGEAQKAGKRHARSRLQRTHEEMLERLSDDLVRGYGALGAAVASEDDDASEDTAEE